MDRDNKIDKINAYRKLLSLKKLPIGKASPELQDEIQKEFLAWVEESLSDLLGEGRPKAEGDLTPGEKDALKLLAAAVTQKASKVAAAATPAPTAPAAEPKMDPLARTGVVPGRLLSKNPQYTENEKAIIARAQPLIPKGETITRPRRDLRASAPHKPTQPLKPSGDLEQDLVDLDTAYDPNAPVQGE